MGPPTPDMFIFVQCVAHTSVGNWVVVIQLKCLLVPSLQASNLFLFQTALQNLIGEKTLWPSHWGFTVFV